ncbi:GDSL-type esterase/lipase family protein [Butyrivibrio sp. FCS014]|uniref:GDSL-type esterase/lipase family protein n=1 Tax=Butyrivibrio sp. FCS014 TaxID=1408304 RepID=UPI000464B1CF|nr:GDSL-type esterase/lipase family protein [Butyrivibrio sp. FCS014]
MKKNLKLITTILLTSTLVLSGCSLKAYENTKTAEEYVSDAIASVEETTEDAAETDSSIVVIENLFEPLLEESTSSAESSTVVNDEQPAEETAEEVDKVEIVFFGDSQFANGRNDGSSIPDMIATRVPNSVVYNMGIGGSTASLEASTSIISPDKVTTNCFVGMAYALASEADRNTILADNHEVLNIMNSITPSKVDYYFIEYGANDFFSNARLDTDMYDLDQIHNYYGALKSGINKLKEISPQAVIFVVSPFYSVYNSPEGQYIGDSYIVSNGIGTLAEYAEKAKNVADDTQVWYIDTMIREHTDLYLDTADQYLMDGVHLTLKGRQIFGRIFAHYVNFCEHNEPFAYLDTDYIKIAEYDTEEYYRYDEAMMKAYYPESWEKYIKGEFPLAQPSEEALSWDN